MIRMDQIGALVAVLLLASQAVAAEGQPIRRASLARFHDPVIVSTAKL